MADNEFDVIVLGAGSTGTVLAGRTAGHGLSTAIVEPHLVGGECAYYACMPSKALLRPAEALDETERVPGAREALRGTEVDARATLERRDEVTHGGDDSGQVDWLDDNEIPLFRGQGVLSGEREVTVGSQTLRARRAVVIATGSSAAVPPIEGLAEAKPWTNREATWAEEVPESLIVLGGGNVGAELSQAFATLGSRVTLIEGSDRILGREEPVASEQVTEAHRERGIDVRVGQKAERVTRGGDGTVTVELEGGESIEAAEILVAIGREPRSSGIGLDSVGLGDLDGEFIEVDDRMRVRGSDWLYAAGDVNGRSLLTHMGKHQSRLLGDIIAGHDREIVEDLGGSPQVTFTDPQVASVGMKSFEAEEKGLDHRVIDQVTSMTAGASFHGKDTGGTSRIIVDEQRKVIVGATFIGTEVGEWLHAATIAVKGEVPLETLWRSVAAYPTRSEIWLKLLEEYGL